MKKSFFLSILAVGALVACSKSEVVDTKFDQAIGFETYLGRAAQTKAAVATSFETAGIYGFYTAGTPYGATSVANLWVNDPLAWKGTVDPAKYWTNENDLYTFLAYAPKDAAGVVVPTEGEVVDPTVTYTVDTDLANQIDLLYAKAINVKKPAENGKVDMTFKHALSRLTVKASAAKDQEFEFRVKDIAIAGNFVTKDVFNLAAGTWAAAGVQATTSTTYSFYSVANNETALTTTATDYAGTDNYLMMIPTTFSETAAATLTVKYTTFYEDTESTVNTVEVPVTTDFVQGKAYSINLVFSKDADAIEFNVTVEPWDPTTGEGDQKVTDEIDQDENIEA